MPRRQTNTVAAPRTRIRRCSIFEKAGRVRAATVAAASDLALKSPMKINDKAPDFTLPDENGKDIALKDLRGKTVILFFYPRANTPG